MSLLVGFKQRLKSPDYQFSEVLAFVDKSYQYQPTAFDNGGVKNEVGQNEGSCKVLALAVLEGFSDEEALLAFGEHYRSVLETPEGSDHLNIRSLQQNGLKAVSFNVFPLVSLSK